MRKDISEDTDVKRVLNTKVKKAAVICLAGAMVITTCTGIELYRSNAADGAYAASKTQKAVEKDYPQITPKVSGNGKLSKNETVYVIKDSNGVQKQVYAEEWLRNGKNADKITDESTLNDIENTAGDETYNRTGDTLVWNAGGQDIRYEGTTNKALPVNVNVSYYLNGVKKTADQIAGKSGKVKICFKYNVNRTDIVNVNGNSYTLKHPYTMASGVMLDNAHFTDVEVSSGKTMDDGNHTVCLGVALPGMSQNLNLQGSSLDIPEEVTITAKTDDFEIDGTYTAVLDGVLGDMNLNSLSGGSMSKLDELTSGLNQLSSAANNLVNGTDKLSSGASQLLTGSQSLQTGADSLASGATSLASGAGSLASGSAQLNTGIQSLYDGLGKLSANSESLRQATYTLENQMFKTAGSQINDALKAQNLTTTVSLTPENYVQQLSGLSDSATKAADTQIRAELTKAGVSDKTTQDAVMSLAYNQLMTAKSAGKTMSVTDALTKAGTMAQEAQAVQTALADKAILSQAASLVGADATQQQISAAATAIYLQKQGMSASDAQSKAKEYLEAAALYQDAAKNTSSNVTALDAYAAEASGSSSGTSSQLTEVKTSLDSLVAYVKAVETYTAGVDSAYAGSKKLLSGAQQLENGAKKLSGGAASLADGAKKLSRGTQSLSSGINSLASGANTLDSGMRTFNSQGIQKLTGELSTSELKDVVNRLEAIQQASKRTEFIGGIPANMTGESRMVVKTMEVKK